MLPDAGHLVPFVLAALALNLTPGPDMLLVIARSVGQGRAAGIAAALGIVGGSVVHTVAAAFGLAALLAVEPLAYQAVKLLGAVYLFYLGVKLLRGAAPPPGEAPPSPAPLVAVFRQGVVTNVLNPKVALFFVAFLPQFVDPAAPAGTAAQMLALGTLFNLGGGIVNGAVACAFGAAGNWLRAQRRFWRWQQRITGGIFVALALRLALPERR